MSTSRRKKTHIACLRRDALSRAVSPLSGPVRTVVPQAHGAWRAQLAARRCAPAQSHARHSDGTMADPAGTWIATPADRHEQDDVSAGTSTGRARSWRHGASTRDGEV